MHRFLLSVAAGVVGLVVSAPAQAGEYRPCNPDHGRAYCAPCPAPYRHAEYYGGHYRNRHHYYPSYKKHCNDHRHCR